MAERRARPSLARSVVVGLILTGLIALAIALVRGMAHDESSASTGIACDFVNASAPPATDQVGGVFVTRPGQVGLLDAATGMVRAKSAPLGSTPKLMQDGLDVFAVFSPGPAEGAARSVDAVTIVADRSIDGTDGSLELSNAALSLPANYGFDARGGTAVVWDERTGRAWIRPSSEVLKLDLTAGGEPPTITVGGDATGVVDVRGGVHLLSLAGHTLTYVGTTTADTPTAEVTTGLSADLRRASMTTVGPRAVILDLDTKEIIVPGCSEAALGAVRHAVLQQPGPAAEDVLVAVDQALMAVRLDGSAGSVLATVQSRDPVAPVRTGLRAYAAWKSPGWVVSVRDGEVAENQPAPVDASILANGDHVALDSAAWPTSWSLVQTSSPASPQTP